MKNKLRQFAKEYRKTLDTKALGEKIYNKLLELSEYKAAKNVCCYYSFGEEVSTIKLFEDKRKNWFLPKIEGDNLLICPYDKNNLQYNKYKILEAQTLPTLSNLDMIIIPALAADKKGYRIGYGKGYYDRLLKQINYPILKVILTYSDLLLATIYPDTFDEKCDIIITDKEIYKINC